MNRLFQIVVIAWGLYHVVWIVAGSDAPILERLALTLVAAGFWTCVGALLVRRNRTVRLLLLVAVVGQTVFLVGEANFWMFDYYYFEDMPTDPSTGWAMNLSLLSTGLVLVVVYVTPVANDFEVSNVARDSKVRAVVSAITRTDGATITSVTAIVLVFFVVNQFVIAARYAEDSPHAIVSWGSERVEAVQSSGDEQELRDIYVELGDAYWVLDHRDQAASMYEKYVELDLEDQSYRYPYDLSWVIPRLLNFYSTAAADHFGDGARALETAEKMPESLRKAAYFDSVAAVYARLGQMDNAVRSQQLAVDMCTSNGWCCVEHREYADRLEQYSSEEDTGRS